MYHRQCRRTLGESRAVRRDAKMPSISTPAPAAPGKSVPCKPLAQGTGAWPHRDILQKDGLYGLVMVARSVKPKEVKTNEKARASLQKTWGSLRAIGAWAEAGVQEWRAVREASKRDGKRVNAGMAFGIVVAKGSELPEGDPGR